MFINALAAQDFTAREIEALLKAKLPTEVVSRKTIQRRINDQQRDPSEPWSFAADSGIDPALVLPILKAVVALTNGRRAHLTSAEAQWVARIRGADATVPEWLTYLLAREYLRCAKAERGTGALDLLLALQPWLDKWHDYAEFVDAGIPAAPTFLLHQGIFATIVGGPAKITDPDALVELPDEPEATGPWVRTMVAAVESLKRSRPPVFGFNPPPPEGAGEVPVSSEPHREGDDDGETPRSE